LVVRVNDRGPYHGNRLIDVSNKAAELLEFKLNGVAAVRVEYVGRAPLEGSDDRQLMATLRTGVPAPSPSTVRIASARPFVPELAPSERSIGGDVPTSRGRPYTPDHTAMDVASISADSEMSASGRTPAHRQALEGPREVSYGEGDGTGHVRPVTAYAPVDQRGPSELLSGRGLY
jgi:rare lipoprotein A